MCISPYNELRRQGRLERIRNLMRILTDAPVPRPYPCVYLTQALLPPMPRRCGAVRSPESRLLSRLPPLCWYRAAISLRCVTGAGGSRRAEAVVVLFLRRGHEIGLEGGELVGRIGTRVPRQRRRHCDCALRGRGLSYIYRYAMWKGKDVAGAEGGIVAHSLYDSLLW